MTLSTGHKSRGRGQGERPQTEVILESLSEGICQLSAAGEITYLNRAAESMLGKSRDEVVGKPYWEVLYSKPLEEFSAEQPFCPINFTLTSGEISHVKSELFTGNGKREIQVEYICVPLFEANEIRGAVVSFQDIAERIEVESAISAARDAALAAAESRGAFLANMSHESRTPLNGILGTANLLLDSDLPEDQRKFARNLMSSAEMLRSILNEILDFSKVDAGAYVLEKHAFDIYELAENAAEIFLPVSGQKGIGLRFDFGDQDAGPLIGDQNKIRQVLNNLLSNAIKFTETGEVVIAIRVESADDSTNDLRIEVSDTGIGIRENDLFRLFEPFVQTDSTTTRHFGGTGLGLAICRRLVERMGGEIGVESTVGKGSTFWITARFERLTKSNEDSVTDSRYQIETISAAESANFPEDLEILVVEDNPVNRAVAGELLNQLGIASECVSNGFEAIEAAKSGKFRVILMDCRMPEIDGLEATRRIREIKGETLKIFAVSAGNSVEERAECINAGMDDYLAKPFNKTELRALLVKHLKPGAGPSFSASGSGLEKHPFSEIVDPDKLENFLEIESNGKYQFTNEILNLFLRHSEKLISEINSAADKGEFGKISKAAHNLKGSSGNAGLTKLSALFDGLEKDADRENSKRVCDAVNNINSEFEKTKKIILSER